MKRVLTILITGAVLFASCNTSTQKEDTSEVSDQGTSSDSLIYPQEKHFKNMRQLTFGGDNAEAYWNSDDTQLVMQSNYEEWGLECDQIFY